MKKSKCVLGLVSLSLLLTACGMGGVKTSKDGQTGESKIAEIAIKSGEFIILEDELAEEGKGYLALEIAVKNKSKKSLHISNSDISLYDEEGDMIELADAYPPEDTIKLLNYDKIAADKSKTGYIIFEVNRGSEYELHFEPEYYDIESSDENIKEIVLQVDTKKYADNTKESIPAATAFVDMAFLSRDNEEYDKLILNSKEETIKAFNDKFVKAFANEFTDYTPTEEELNKLVETFKTENGKVAEVEYEMVSYFPDSAIVLVKPKVLSFDNMEDMLETVSDKYIDEYMNGDSVDYDKLYLDVEKYLLDHMPEVFAGSSIVEADEYEEGYQIMLKKKDGKWEVNTSSSGGNYEYEYLEEAFRGGMYN